MRKPWLIPVILLALLAGCHSGEKTSPPTETSDEGVRLTFTVDVNRDLYLYTDFGEPPQLAVWLEQPDSGRVKTVWVSHRTGKNQWKGKVICPVSLPYWESRHKLEDSAFRERSLMRRLVDALTGATPKGGEFTVETRVPPGSRWHYFVEVNLSADYNRYFPFWMADGTPDPECNGQPSIIYQGVIQADSGFVNQPELAGRTHQLLAVDTLITDVSTITTARDILLSIEARCEGDESRF